MLLGVCACISLSLAEVGEKCTKTRGFFLAQKRLWIFSPNSQNKVFRICPNFWWRHWPQNFWLWRHNGGVKNGDFSILRSDMVEWYLKWKVWTQRLQIWFCFISVTSSRDVIIEKCLFWWFIACTLSNWTLFSSMVIYFCYLRMHLQNWWLLRGSKFIMTS